LRKPLLKEAPSSAIKQSAKKLVRTYNGQENPSHRFSEKFRNLHGLPTQIRENIKLDKKLSSKMNGVENTVNESGKYVERGADPDLKASKMLQGFKSKMREKLRKTYTNSALSTTTETNNVLDIDNRGKEITIKGPGGIQSEHAIQPENIELHPSRLGLMDVVNTPTGSPGRSMPLAKGAAVGEDGDMSGWKVEENLPFASTNRAGRCVGEGGLALRSARVPVGFRIARC
jgi:hypothetical protein